MSTGVDLAGEPSAGDRAETHAAGSGGRTGPDDRQDRLRLFLAEYESLRQESAQARDAQQSIMQWSIGAFAAVLVAGLALPDQGPGSTTMYARLALFGLGLPVLVFGASLAWFGELYRMERAGHYLRCREAGFRSAAPPGGIAQKGVEDWIQFPLLWETLIHDKEDRKLKRNFDSGFAVYLSVLIFSMGMALIELISERFAGGNLLKILGISYLVALTCLYMWLMWGRFRTMRAETTPPAESPPQPLIGET